MGSSILVAMMDGSSYLSSVACAANEQETTKGKEKKQEGNHWKGETLLTLLFRVRGRENHIVLEGEIRGNRKHRREAGLLSSLFLKPLL